jgi:Ca2+-binding EF-hand superfamily protein
MTRITTLIILPLALMLGACDREDTDNAEPKDGAVAQDDEGGRGPHGRGGLKKLDTDKDGTISLAEAKGHRIADKFAEIDVDKDGKLSRDELHAMKKGHHGKGERGWHGERGEGERGWHGKDPAERAAMMMARFDADKDGSLTAAELGEHPHMAEKFAELDADKDGKLSTTELAAMKHGKDPAERAAKMMARFDADKDGSLTAAELAEHPHMAEQFAEVDTDKDGKLSVAELTAFKASHPGKGHGRGHGRGHGEGHEKGRGEGHDEARG